MKRSLIKTLDVVSAGVLLVGAANSTAAGMTRWNATRVLAKRSRPAVRAFYAGLGAATLYRMIRMMAPKTKEERRLQQVAHLYDQAEAYNRRAQLYRRAAETFFKRRRNSLKSAISS